MAVTTKDIEDRILTLSKEHSTKAAIHRELVKVLGDSCPSQTTVRRILNKTSQPVFSKTLETEMPIAPKLSATYAYASKHDNHRRIVYSDLSSTGGNIFALSSAEMLDVPAALSCGIEPGRLFITSNEFTAKHAESTSANVIIANDIMLALAKIGRHGITFSGANIDTLWALNEDTLARMYGLGASDVWEHGAVISINVPSLHNSPIFVMRRNAMLADESFIQLVRTVFNITMPDNYINTILPNLVNALACVYEFCFGAASGWKPYGAKHGIYNGKDDTTHTKMGWITFCLTPDASDEVIELNTYLEKLVQ